MAYDVGYSEPQTIPARRQLKLLGEGNSVFQGILILRRIEVEVESPRGLRRGRGLSCWRTRVAERVIKSDQADDNFSTTVTIRSTEKPQVAGIKN